MGDGTRRPLSCVFLVVLYKGKAEGVCDLDIISWSVHRSEGMQDLVLRLFKRMGRRTNQLFLTRYCMGKGGYMVERRRRI